MINLDDLIQAVTYSIIFRLIVAWHTCSIRYCHTQVQTEATHSILWTLQQTYVLTFKALIFNQNKLGENEKDI